MYDGVHFVFMNNSAITSRIPAFGPAIQNYEDLLKQIKGKTNEIRTVAAGKTAEKKRTKNQLIEMLVPVVSALQAFARRTQNDALALEAKLTRSEMRRMRGTNLATRAISLQTTVQSVLPQLADFGITGSNLTELNALITKFQTSFGCREESVANRIAARITLKALFDPIDTILKMDLDRMMELIKKDELQFYHACFSARAIKNYGHRHKIAMEEPVVVEVASAETPKAE
jgi:hypothetical protein